MDELYGVLSKAVGIRVSRPTAAIACVRAIGIGDLDKRISKLTSRRHHCAHPDSGILADVCEAIASIRPDDLLSRVEAFRAHGNGAEGKKAGELSKAEESKASGEVAEEARKVEEARLAKEAKWAVEAGLVEAKLAGEARQVEKAWFVEEERKAEEIRLAEEAR